MNMNTTNVCTYDCNHTYTLYSKHICTSISRAKRILHEINKITSENAVKREGIFQSYIHTYIHSQAWPTKVNFQEISK